MRKEYPNLDQMVFDLERRIELLEEWPSKLLAAFGDRIAALEAKLANADGVVLDFRAQSLEPIIARIAALEAALAKQRAVNEALESVLPHIHRDVCFRHQWKALENALREALK